MNRYLKFVGQVREVSDQYPKLSHIEVNGKAVLKGEIDIVDRDGKYWDSYLIEIHYREGFPNRFPLVFETGQKIPKIGDWHINEDDKSCCIKVLPEELIICKDGIFLTDFIAKEVIPYFFNQTYRRVEGYYANGEYSHGVHGIYEFYSEILNTGSNIKKTIQILFSILKNDKPGRTHDCFCGSGEKFRKCHRKAYKYLSMIDSEELSRHILMIGRFYNLI